MSTAVPRAFPTEQFLPDILMTACFLVTLSNEYDVNKRTHTQYRQESAVVRKRSFKTYVTVPPPQ